MKVKVLSLLIATILVWFFWNNDRLHPNLNLGIQKCKSEKNQICYKDLIIKVFNKTGLDASLDLVEKIYSIDSSFSSVCHDVGHVLGAETYKLFKSGKNFKVTPKVAFCSYGFYHGFMEYLAAEGDVEKARDFCRYVDAQVAKVTPDASLQCYHGIGHGWVNIHGDKTLLGDDVGIVKKGLSLCEKVASNESELSRCATGVFNGIAIFYESGEYDLQIKKDDPMWICKRVDKKFEDACYVSMNTVLFAVTGQDFAKSAKYIEGIKDDMVASHAMINLSLPFSLAEMDKVDHSRSIAVCRGLQPRLTVPCLQGFAFAYMEHGEPGKEYLKATGFCKDNGLTPAEEKGCLGYIYGYMAQWYPADKAYAICKDEGDYSTYCSQKVEEGLEGLGK